MTTIRDVARLANVSVSTVSYALSRERRIREDTRDRVLDAIDALGYRANDVARSLKTGRTLTLGLIIPDILNPFFTVVARAAEDTAIDAGYSLMLCNSCNDAAREYGYLGLLRSRRVDGLIFMAGSGTPHRALRALIRQGFPIVIVDEELAGIEATSIFVQNYEGGRQAGEHLAQLGHRRVGIIGGPPALKTARDRVAGVRDALADHGVAIDPDCILAAEYQIECGRDAMKRLLDRPIQPSAVFAANDMIAIGATQQAEAEGLNVPDDISIVGFDDVPLAAMIAPALTTVAQPMRTMGRRAVELLLQVIRERPVAHARVTLETELRVRASTGPAPAFSWREGAAR